MLDLYETTDDGVLEQIEREVVDHDPDGRPIFETYPLYFQFPPSPRTPEHRAATLPYVLALIFAFAPGPEDIGF